MPRILNFPVKKIREGSVEIYISTENKISKQMPVFYNPMMKLNRDITILLLKQFSPMRLCDPLAGTGVRAIRFAKELKYKSIVANDISEKGVALIKKNIKLNKLKFEVKNEDANIMLLKSKGFDFIDLDVFGSPNFILDSAIRRLARDSILAVTATDTAPLAGTYPKACIRKYWAIPLRNELKHEIGLRILIRKIQLIGTQYDKALTPIFSYFKDYYFRIFFRCTKAKKEVDNITNKYAYLLYCNKCLNKMISNRVFNSNTCKNCNSRLDYAGPLWFSKLFDNKLVNKMYKCENNALKNKELRKFLKIIKQESKIHTVGFYDIHKIVKKYNLKQIPKKECIINKIKRSGYKVATTHFNANGIRSNIDVKELVKLINI
jgi:tRNA (guanine26-N2/guanine27-N2)-dimethyltransferase